MTGKRMLIAAAVVVMGGTVLSAVPARAETVNLDAVKDGFIYGNATYANYNWGASPDLHVGMLTYTMKSIIAFDLTDLSGEYSEITGITLHLYANKIDNTGGQLLTTSVYEIAQTNGGWAEGTGGSGGTNGESGTACWAYKAYDTAGWAGSAGLSTAGTDYVNTLLDSTSVPTTGWVEFTFAGSNAELTALIDRWMTTNAGLLLQDDTPGLSGRNQVLYNSSEDSANRPYLTVEYAVPEPATMAMLGLGGVMMLIRRRRS